MPTNLELQAEIKRKDQKIEELENELKALKGKPAEAKPAVISKGLSGFIIETDPKFNGIRLGVMFRNGRGILLDNPTSEHTILQFKHDLGYSVTRSENLLEQPESAEQMKKSLVDVLMR